MGERQRTIEIGASEGLRNASLISDGQDVDPPSMEGAGQPVKLLIAGDQAEAVANLLSASDRAGLTVSVEEIDRLATLRSGEKFDIALVSAIEPSPNWQQIIQFIKTRFGVPVLCLLPMTSNEQHADTCRWLADDIAFMPVRADEVEVRLSMLLRKAKQQEGLTYPLIERRRSQMQMHQFSPGKVTPLPSTRFRIDDRTKTVCIGPRNVHLSPKEYRLLTLLASDCGRVFSAREISICLWPKKSINEPDVHQYVYLLRHKIEIDPREPKWILTEQGFGYKLQIPSG